MPLESLPSSGLKIAADGQVVPGIHDCTLNQLRSFAMTNPCRQAMWSRLISFLIWPVLVPRFSHIYIGGGFLSSTSKPKDIDVILQTKEPYGPQSFAALEPFFVAGLENIRKIYSIDLYFWMDGTPSGLTDYRVFFQYCRSKKASKIFCSSRGIARIPLTGLALKTELKKHLSLLCPVDK